MNYFYAVVWYLVGLLLIVELRKEHPVIVWLGIYFLFVGAWWTVRAATGTDVFSGAMGWIFRGVTAAAVAAAGTALWRERRKRAQDDGEKKQ